MAQVKLASPGSFNAFKDALTTDPRVNLRIERETEYYAGQSRVLRQLVDRSGVSRLHPHGPRRPLRRAQHDVHRGRRARPRDRHAGALGFGGFAVMLSVLAESLLLAALGGVIGAALAYLAFDGYQAATMNWQTFSQVAFAFDVTPQLMISAIEYALVIGFVGGLFPAIRAARLPLAVALRER